MDFFIYLKIINYLIKIIFLIFIFVYILIIKKFGYKLIENQLKNYFISVFINKTLIIIIKYFESFIRGVEKNENY